MYSIENDQIKVGISSKGAELQNLFSKDTGLEYLWNGDPAYWGKRSPILFPIVGTLKNDTYKFEGKEYKMGRHGFARDMNFEVVQQDAQRIIFSLNSSAETLEKFPFEFKLEVVYAVKGNELFVGYNVYNNSAGNMYFSIGGHPAFKIPVEEELNYEDYYFEFNKEENALRWMISSEGLINPNAVPVITNSNILPVTRELFSRDAVVMKHINSDSVKLKTDKSKHGTEFTFYRFPYLGLWTAKGGNFICIEPWCGIADSTTSDQELINKEGINLLVAGEVFKREWSVRVY